MNGKTISSPLPGPRLAVLLVLTTAFPLAAAQADPREDPLGLDFPELRARVVAFRSALAELATRPPATNSRPAEALSLSTRYQVQPNFYVDELAVPLPGARDLVFEEQFFIGEREDAYVSAARHWLGRRLKGSDRRGRTRARARVKAKLSWDHGPIAGVGVGPLSVRAGEEHWRLQYRTSIRMAGGAWSSHVRVGEDEGDLVAEFLIGRSLLNARTR